MSNYTKATDFAAKDALASGNPSKVVKGTEIDTEFNAIATAVATKLDTSGGTDLAVADGGTGASTASGARTNLGAAASGANSDITSLSGLTTALSVAQGGTGSTTLTANNVLLGNGTSALQAVAPGTSGNVLTSNGTTWASSAPSSSGGLSGETTYNTNTTLSVSTDHAYLIRCTTASVVYTFPAATGNEGKWWYIQNATSTDTGVRLVCNGAESIGGATGSTIYIPAYTTIGFVSDGANWIVFQYSGKRNWVFTASGTLYPPPWFAASIPATTSLVAGGGGGTDGVGAGGTGGTSSVGSLASVTGGAGNAGSNSIAVTQGGSPRGFNGGSPSAQGSIEAGGHSPFGRGGIGGNATHRAAEGYGAGGKSSNNGGNDIATGGGGGWLMDEPITLTAGSGVAITVGAGGTLGTGGTSGGEAGRPGLVIVRI